MSPLALLGLVASCIWLNLAAPAAAQHVADSSTGECNPRKILPLERQKLCAEVEKLRAETAKLSMDARNSDRDIRSSSGVINFLHGNGAIILGIAAGIWAVFKYRRERQKQLADSEEQRFASITKDLGGDTEQLRMSAAVLLPSFLRPGYERFYLQVFNLANGNLRLLGDAKDSNGIASLRQALVIVFREAFPKARAIVIKNISDRNSSYEIESNLNASEISLDGAYLVGADLQKCWLRNASLNNSILRIVRLEQAVLEGASMKEADLEDAVLSRANLQDADLSFARATGADFSFSKLQNTNLREADLRNANFSEATLTGASFLGAILDGADFSGAIFLSETGEQHRTSIDAASSLEGARLFGVRGLSKRQLAICREKGALLPPISEEADPPLLADRASPPVDLSEAAGLNELVARRGPSAT